jgi:hypothetical protein
MIKIKGLINEDFVNYKKPNMFIIFPKCNWKCEKDCGEECCQNKILKNEKEIEINENSLVDSYIDDMITSAIVIGGLEPFDSFEDLTKVISAFRFSTNDDIVIYTGYNENEISAQISFLSRHYSNIIVKFGRFVPHKESHFEELLGINLSSPNQYAKKI